MVLDDRLFAVERLLLEAARTKGVLPFSVFHAVFDPESTDYDKYDTLEAASRAIVTSELAIYSAVLARKSDNCPGIGFYDIFNNVHRDEFYNVAGHNDLHQLTDEDRVHIAEIERARVYAHAEDDISGVESTR